MTVCGIDRDMLSLEIFPSVDGGSNQDSYGWMCRISKSIGTNRHNGAWDESTLGGSKKWRAAYVEGGVQRAGYHCLDDRRSRLIHFFYELQAVLFCEP